MTSQSVLPTSKPRHFALVLVLYAVLFAAFALAAMQAPTSEDNGAIFVSVLVGSAVAIFGVWTFSDRKTDLQALRTFIFVGMVVDVGFNLAAAKLKDAAASSLVLKALSSTLLGAGNLGLLAAAIGVGLVLGRGLKKPNYLIMAAIVGALTDIVSVYAGPSKHVNGSAVFDYVSFKWGVIGLGGIQPIIGAGDFIFLALYFFGARRFGLDDLKTLWAMLIAIAAGFVLTLFLGAVPALPFMSLALLLTHGRALKEQMRASDA